MINMAYIFLILITLQLVAPIFTFYILPKKYYKYFLLYNMVVGIFILVIVTSTVSFIGFPFNNAGNAIVISILLGLNGTFLFFSRKEKKTWDKNFTGILHEVFNKEVLIIFAISFASCLLFLYPIIKNNSFGAHAEAYIYVSIADYLQEASFFPMVDYSTKPYLFAIYIYQKLNLRMGAQFVLSFISSIFNVKYSIFIFQQMVAVMQFAFLSSVYIFAKHGLKLRKKIVIPAVVFAGFHFLLLDQIILNFFPQLFGFVSMMIIYSVFSNVENWNKNKRFYLTIGAISASSLIISYSEMLPFAVVGCLMLLIFSMRKKKNRKPGFIITSKMVGLIIILCNYNIYRAISAILFQIQATVGGDVKMTLMNWLTSLISTVPLFYYKFLQDTNHILFAIIVVVSSIVIMITISKFFNNKANKQAKQKLRIMLVIYALVFIYLRFFVINPFILNEYGQTFSIFKLCVYVAPFIAIILSISLNELIAQLPKRFMMICLIIITAGFALLNSAYGLQRSNHLASYSRLDSDLTEYKKFADEYNKEHNTINLIFGHGEAAGHKKMLTYFLQDATVYGMDGNISKIQNSGPESMYKFTEESINLVYQPANENTIANMVEISKIHTLVSNVVGFKESEVKDNDKWIWSISSDSSLQLISLEENTEEYFIEFSINTKNVEKSALDIYLNGSLIEQVSIDSSQDKEVSLRAKLNPGENILSFDYDGEPVNVNEQQLYFRIINFQSTIYKTNS